MGYIFTAAHVLALVRLLWARYQYPCFVAAVALWTAQAANTTIWQGTTREWVATWWLFPEIALLLATAAATVEAIERERSAGFAGVQLRVASIGIPACLAGFGCRFIAPPSGDVLATFTGLRVWIWAYLALSLLVVTLLVLLKGKNRPALHSWLLLVVLMDHALISPFAAADHPGWRMVYRAVLVACLLIWAIFAPTVRNPAVSPPSPQ